MAGTLQTLTLRTSATGTLPSLCRNSCFPATQGLHFNTSSPNSSLLRKLRSLPTRPIRAGERSDQVNGAGTQPLGVLADFTSWARPLLNFVGNNFLSLALVGGVALGLANPSLGCLADRFYLSKFSTFGVFVISGLTLNSEEIVAAAGAWPVGFFGLGSILFLTPFFSRIILQLQLQPQEFVTGLAIFSCMPTTLLSGVTLTRIAGGNAALALAMTVMSNMLGIFVVPLSISKFIAAGVGVSVPAKQLFRSLVLTLLVPLILGKVLRESLKGLADFADRNRKRLSLMSALLLALVPLIQVSRSRSLLLMVRPAVFLVAVVSGILLHLILLAFNALLIQSLSALSGGGNSIFAQKQNARALLLVASQKTLPVMVAVVEQLGGAFGESGLLVLPCVAAHFNQTVIDSFLVSSWLQKDDCPATQRPSET